jgi:hypothetical protein
MFVRLFAEHAPAVARRRGSTLIAGAPLPPLSAFDAYVMTGSRLGHRPRGTVDPTRSA